jgi:two-component system heavy metal sensor histidine kinase CusS
VSLLLIAAMGGYLYLALDAGLDEEHNVFLGNEIELVRRQLAEVDYAHFIEHPFWPRAARLMGSRLHIAIRAPDGVVLTATSAYVLPVSVLPPPADIGRRAQQSVVWKSGDGRYFRVVSGWAQLGGAQPMKVLVSVALDISLEKHFLNAHHVTLLVTMLFGAACAATLGYAVTRRGLAPVRRIAEAAREITSSRLDRKLDLDDTPAELVEVTNAFNGMLARLEESFSRLSQFSSDLAHELRTPINNLMGEAQVALSRPRSADEYHAVLASSVEEFERLSRMIENMLFLARADHNEMKVSPVRVQARAELDKLAEFYQVVADDSQVRIRCVGDALVYADPILLRRAVTNLLSNALQYSPEGAEVVVEAKGGPNGAASIAVSNPGPGIPSESLSRIFDRFFRLEPSRFKTSGGAGLGLSIVRTIMWLHGGSVTAQSDPGGLTVFTLYFAAPAA